MSTHLMNISSAFASDLYKNLIKNESGNFVFSPISIQSVLALLSFGADNDSITKKEMLEGLKFPPGMKAVATLFEQFYKAIKESNIDVVHHHNALLSKVNFLMIATKIYLMKGYEFKQSFKEIAEKNFNSDVETVDFAENEEAAGIINEWIQEQTKMKIQKVVDPSSLNEDTRMICVNAIYFKALWDHYEFTPAKQSTFFVTENNSIETDFLERTNFYDYAFLNEIEVHALKMNYKNSNVSLIILLPDKRTGLEKLENNLQSINFVDLSERFENRHVKLKLPKFKIETTVSMNQALQDIGMRKMFTSDAKFYEVFKKYEDSIPLHVEDVYQKALISIDEKGTEATAASYMRFRGGCQPPEPIDFIADHPFMFVLKNKDAVLFMGRVTKP